MDIAALGIPSEEVMIETYSDCRQVADLKDNWNFYLAFTFFRVAAILQGVYKRSLQSKSIHNYIAWRTFFMSISLLELITKRTSIIRPFVIRNLDYPAW